MRRLLIAALIALALTGAAACGPTHRHYCFGEGGRIDECVSLGSPGQR